MAEPAPPVAEPGPLNTAAIRAIASVHRNNKLDMMAEVIRLCDRLDAATALLREARLDVEPGLDPKFLRARIDSFLGGQE